MAGVIEFKSERAYQFWLQGMGDRIRVLDVSKTKRWSLWTGFLGNAKTYTVTYERISRASPRSGMPAQQPEAQPLAGYCNGCGSALHEGSRFCSHCGATVEPCNDGNGTVGSATERIAATAKEAGCAVCKFLNPLDASVCVTCGKRLNKSTTATPPPSNEETLTPKSGRKANRWVWVFIAAVFVVMIGIGSLAPRTPEDNPLAREGLSPDFCEKYPNADICNPPNPAISKPEEKPPDPASQKSDKSKTAVPPATTSSNQQEKARDAAALKAIREEWIKNAQQDLWRQGMEMTVQARGTTLYVEYALAGQAFAFQFGETFLGKNGATLKALGFKKVYLSNGEGGWTWDLSRY